MPTGQSMPTCTFGTSFWSESKATSMSSCTASFPCLTIMVFKTTWRTQTKISSGIRSESPSPVKLQNSLSTERSVITRLNQSYRTSKKDDAGQYYVPFRRLRSPLRYLSVAAIVWLFGLLWSLGGDASKENKENQQREYDLKVQEHELSRRDYELKIKGYWLTVVGSFGTACALVFGYFQYRKADRWKRAEFLAKEMKGFFSDPDVRNVLMMIDWAERRINLLLIDNKNSKRYPR